MRESIRQFNCIKCSIKEKKKKLKRIKYEDICKQCKKLQKVNDSIPAVLLYLFLMKLSLFSDDLVDIIKLYKFPHVRILNIENSTYNCNLDSIRLFIGKYTFKNTLLEKQSHNNILDIRFNKNCIKYFFQHKKRLEKHLNTNQIYKSEYTEKEVQIDFGFTSLIYIPYVKYRINYDEQEFLTFDEELYVDYEAFELDLLRREMRKIDKVFDSKTARYINI